MNGCIDKKMQGCRQKFRAPSHHSGHGLLSHVNFVMEKKGFKTRAGPPWAPFPYPLSAVLGGWMMEDGMNEG